MSHVRSLRFRRETVTLVIAILILTLSTSAHAQVKPGDLITADNAYKVNNLVAPGVLYKIQNGMTMKIVPSAQIDWPPPYKDATEKYADQVRLSPDGRSILNYVAGQPFPFLDPNDPNVATDSQSLHSKTLLYIDSEVWFPLYEDEYDPSGQLWQNHTYWLTDRDRPVPDARSGRALANNVLSRRFCAVRNSKCPLTESAKDSRETWALKWN